MPDDPQDPTAPPDQTPPNEGPIPPPPPWTSSSESPDAPSRSPRRTLLIAVVAAVVVVLGGGAAAAFFMMRGSSEQLVGLVPEQADVFATAYLDPSAAQKMNLLALARKFPDVGEGKDLSQRMGDLLDLALEDSGLTAQDVTPWLGSQIAFSVDLGDDGTPHVAALIATTDPDASRAAMEKVTAGQDVRRSDHDGVEVSVSPDGDGAYAIVDGVLVLASDETTVQRAIDTAHGTLPNLGDAQTYVDTLAGLPEGKLGVAYVNVAGLVDQFGSETATSAALGAGGLSDLDSIESIGVSLSAEPDGVALDATTNYDPTKLSPEQREMLAAPDHENTTMAFVPADAFAVVGAEHVDTGLRSTLDTLEQQMPDASASIDQAGIREFVAAMNGDIALEVGPGTGGPVSGALLVGTDDPEQMQTFLDTVAGFASQAIAQVGAVSSTPDDLLQQMEACQGTPQQIQVCQQELLDRFDPSSTEPTKPGLPATEEYQGVTISYLDEPSLAELGVAPAYAVVDGAGVIATSPDEIHQLIDTKASGEDVRSGPVFTSATASVPTDEGVFFLDVRAIAEAVRQNLPPDDQAFYDADVAPNIAPITAFVVGSESDEEHQTIRMFLQIT